MDKSLDLASRIHVHILRVVDTIIITRVNTCMRVIPTSSIVNEETIPTTRDPRGRTFGEDYLKI